VSIAKETKVIAALKQHYERYHAEDLAALKELYEYHAENCVRAAELTVDPRRRGDYKTSKHYRSRLARPLLEPAKNEVE
jgi:hypothetical protein